MGVVGMNGSGKTTLLYQNFDENGVEIFRRRSTEELCWQATSPECITGCGALRHNTMKQKIHNLGKLQNTGEFQKTPVFFKPFYPRIRAISRALQMRIQRRAHKHFNRILIARERSLTAYFQGWET